MSNEEKIEVKGLTIKNGHLEKLIGFLDTPLHGTEARARNKFVTVVGKQIMFLTSERQRILKEYSEKDEKGEAKTINDGKEYDITSENLAKVNEEMNTLYNSDFVIDILPSNAGEIKMISKLILETKKEFDLIEGSIYDKVAEAFEAIK
jgi:hypothetical protein